MCVCLTCVHSLAVQFCTTPSCAKRRKRVKLDGEEEEEESLLCQFPGNDHGHIFLVKVDHANKECVCPFTDEHFIAPQLTPGEGADPSYDEVGAAVKKVGRVADLAGQKVLLVDKARVERNRTCPTLTRASTSRANGS